MRGSRSGSERGSRSGSERGRYGTQQSETSAVLVGVALREEGMGTHWSEASAVLVN